MPFEKHFLRYPFSGVRSRVTKPIPGAASQPKFWTSIGFTDAFGDNLYTTKGGIVAAGVVPGDSVWVHTACPHYQFTDTIRDVFDDYVELNNTIFDVEYNCMVIKIGVGAWHTMQSLATIIADRGIAEHTLRFNKLWTSAPLSDFNYDETGEVYCVNGA